MKKVVSKGYTLSVTSWENDGDNYQTESKTFDTKEEAVKIAKMCKELFCSSNNREKGIGNTCGEKEEKEAEQTILKYLKNNPNFFDNQSEMDDGELIDRVRDINYQLMGASEFYYSRVYDKATITYSPNDIFLEEIKF